MDGWLRLFENHLTAYLNRVSGTKLYIPSRNAQRLLPGVGVGERPPTGLPTRRRELPDLHPCGLLAETVRILPVTDTCKVRSSVIYSELSNRWCWHAGFTLMRFTSKVWTRINLRLRSPDGRIVKDWKWKTHALFIFFFFLQLDFTL